TVQSFPFFFFFSSRRRHTRFSRDWSSDVCSSDLLADGTVQLAQIDFLDEADTVAALITALAAEDREEVRRLSTQVSIADFLFDSYAGATLEVGECTSTSGHPWGEAMCRVGVTGSSEDPAEIYLRKVGFGEWLMEAFQSPRFVNH